MTRTLMAPAKSMSLESLNRGKAELRKIALQRRAALAVDERARHSEAATSRLLADPAYLHAQVVCAYANFGDELDTHTLCVAARSDRKTLLLPRVEKNSILVLHVVGPHTALKPNRIGIFEPAASEASMEASQVDLFVVPGLAFDAHGARLGYGRGYYDRLLSKARADACMVGVVFEAQLVPQVPTTTTDVAMHMVITEAQTLHCRR